MVTMDAPVDNNVVSTNWNAPVYTDTLIKKESYHGNPASFIKIPYAIPTNK